MGSQVELLPLFARSKTAIMSSQVVARVQKPVMKGMFIKQLNTQLFWGAVVSTGLTAAYKLWEDTFYNNHFDKFYDTYDINKDFELKMKAGVFQCVDCNGVIRVVGED